VKGSGDEEVFDPLVESIREVGWDILAIEERQRKAERWWVPQPEVGFTMRRKGAGVSG
jgi:hypothetical protein